MGNPPKIHLGKEDVNFIRSDSTFNQKMSQSGFQKSLHKTFRICYDRLSSQKKYGYSTGRNLFRTRRVRHPYI